MALYTNNARLQEIWDTMRKEPKFRNESNAARIGENYRDGRDITAQDLSEAFGFRGIEFWNWADQANRQSRLNDTYDALMDLSRVLNVPPKALSLGGQLGIAFGSRGSGNAMAHYEKDLNVINLTKTKGAGSLAHEWFHAMDRYFGNQAGHGHSLMSEHSALTLEGIRPELRTAWQKVVNTLEEHPLTVRSRLLDAHRTKPYWGTLHERAARAFESYTKESLEQNDKSNEFLVNLINTTLLEDFDKARHPYPMDAEMTPIQESFDQFFKTVETKEKDGNVIMFSRKEIDGKMKIIPEGAKELKTESAQNLFIKSVERVIGETRTFGQKLDQYLNGELEPRYDLQVTRTPKALKQLGVKDLPIYISQGVLKKVTGEKHSLTIDDLHLLPVALNQPIMIFHSNTDADSYVLLTEMEEDGKNVIVPLALDVKRNGHHIHAIKSIYGKDGLNSFITQNIADGNLVYRHEKRTSILTSRSRLQLPRRHSPQRPTYTIDDNSPFVKLDEWKYLLNNEGISFGNEVKFSRKDPATSGRSWQATGLQLWNDLRVKDHNSKTDISKFDTLLGNISFYSEKVPALQRTFEAGCDYKDNSHQISESLFRDEQGNSDHSRIVEYSKSIRSRAEWKKLQEHLMKKDRDAIGYRIEETAKDQFELRNADGKTISVHTTEVEGWNAAQQAERTDMLKDGWSEAAADTVVSFRKVLGRQYDMLRRSYVELKKRCDENGTKMPEADGIDLWDELKKMGDRRGYYMPRLRKNGTYMLWAKKDGINPRLEMFDTKSGRAIRASQLRKLGFELTFEKSSKPSEEAYLGMDVASMNDFLQNAMEQLSKDGEFTFEQFGLKGEWETYTTKDGKNERHFVVNGKDSKHMKNLFKWFGGKFYEDEGQWHFLAKEESFEKVLLDAVAHFKGIETVNVEAVGKLITKQIAEMIHARGSRSRMISRDGRVGKDVYLGYEEDPLKALTMSCKATAAGTAKTQMAKTILHTIAGTDISFQEFAKEKRNAELKKGTAEYTEESSRLYGEYREFVKDRRIDSGKQPNAFKEAKEFLKEMLRNEESSERVIGTIKGIAALKHLSGLSSALINMTALITNVPAAMRGIGGLNLRRAPWLTAKAGKQYTQYMLRERFGKGNGIKGEARWIFDEITKRGWDTALMNQEAMGVVNTWAGNSWQKVSNLAMLAFSSTERMNRASTIAGTYMGLVEKHKGELSEADKNKYLELAKRVSDKAHGIYGKENLPTWARGSSWGAQAGRSFYMYKTYMHNMFQLMWQLGVKERDNRALAWIMLSPAIVAGLDATLVPIVARLLAATVPGWDEPDDIMEEFYQWLGESFGQAPETLGRYGLAGWLGINIKGSMGIEMPDLSKPPTVADMLGAPYSLFVDAASATSMLLDGEFLRGAETLAPRAISGIPKAYREYSEGITSKNGSPVFYKDQPLKASLPEALWRSLTFNPLGISAKREEQWKEKDVIANYTEMRTGIYNKVRRWLRSGHNAAEWVNIVQEIEAYNARVERHGYDYVTLITKKSLLALEKKMNEPPKMEKIRAGIGAKKSVAERFRDLRLEAKNRTG